MAMTDPLGDMLTRIRNGQQARRIASLRRRRSFAPTCSMCFSAKAIFAAIPKRQLAGQKGLRIELKYFEGQPAIQHLARVSKPGRRVYSASQELAAHPQRPRHDHRVDPARRAVGRRGARPERRRRSAGGGVLMMPHRKTRRSPLPSGVTRHHRGPDPVGQGAQGHARAADARRNRVTKSATTASS